MNLGQMIHARWAANPTLNALLPTARLMTGIYFAGDPGAHFATLTLRGGTVESYANDGSSVDKVTVRIQVHHEDYDLGKAIADAVLAAFDRSDFPLANNARVIAMQRAGMPQETQDGQNGQWDWIIDFHCRVSLTPGV